MTTSWRAHKVAPDRIPNGRPAEHAPGFRPTVIGASVDQAPARAASSFAILSSSVPIASSWVLRWSWIYWASWSVASASSYVSFGAA